MENISSITGLTPAATLRDFPAQTSKRHEVDTAARQGDQVEISELASFLSRLAELPDDRARRIVDVRNAIHNGTYESEDKLEAAVERLFQDLQGPGPASAAESA